MNIKYLVFYLLFPALILSASSKNSGKLSNSLESVLSASGYKGVFLFANKDSVILKNARGFSNLEYSIPNNINTVFNLASLTKHFTAAAILILEERGLLSVTDTIYKYVPELHYSRLITIHELLTHTSGIPNYNNFDDYSQFSKQVLKIDDVIALINEHQLEFSPGSDFKYSNSNYAILASIIERVSGISYADFLTINIFEKLGMCRTGNYSREQIIADRAETYEIKEDGIKKAQWFDYSFKLGSASLFSNIDDLYKWYKGLIGYKIISDSSLNKMFNKYEHGYGYGLGRGKGEVEFYEHDGISPGVSCYIAYFKEPDYFLIMISNYSDQKFFKIRDIIRNIIISLELET